MRKRFLFTWHHHGNINSLYSLFVIHGGGGSCALPQGMINDSAKILFSTKTESSPQTDHFILFKNVHFSSYIHNVDRTRPTRTGFWKNKKDFQVSQLYDVFLSVFPKVFQAWKRRKTAVTGVLLVCTRLSDNHSSCGDFILFDEGFYKTNNWLPKLDCNILRQEDFLSFTGCTPVKAFSNQSVLLQTQNSTRSIRRMDTNN